MIRVGIMDDEKMMLDLLENNIREISVKNNLTLELEFFLCGEKLIERNNENPFHIILLDIEMPSPNGLEVAKLLRQDKYDFVLIFITNRSDLVFQSFEYDVTAFIRKDHMKDELEQAIDRAYQKVLSKRQSYLFKTEAGIRNVQADSICYIASKGHEVKMFDTYNNSIRIMTTMDNLENILSPLEFVRCHSGIIINCRYIFSINSDHIELTNHEFIPLSRRRAKIVKEVFQKYLSRM